MTTRLVSTAAAVVLVAAGAAVVQGNRDVALTVVPPTAPGSSGTGLIVIRDDVDQAGFCTWVRHSPLNSLAPSASALRAGDVAAAVEASDPIAGIGLGAPPSVDEALSALAAMEGEVVEALRRLPPDAPASSVELPPKYAQNLTIVVSAAKELCTVEGGGT